MTILTHEEFLKLPNGTLYMEYDESNGTNCTLKVKHQSIEDIDFVYSDLIQESNGEVDIKSSYRDGNFGHDGSKYLILDVEQHQEIIDFLQKSLNERKE